MTLPARRILLLGTGGTIAGASPAGDPGRYRAGALAIGDLIAGAPGLADRFALTSEQLFSIGSQHITSAHWLQLARRIEVAASDPSIDGVAITHGTDTLEETAFALDLLCARDKSLVLTGAMRPATALAADGPVNLRAACLVAADPAAGGRGPFVVFSDQVWAARHVGKRRTLACDAFDGGEREAEATIIGNDVHWRLTRQAATDAAGRRPGFAGALDLNRDSLPPVALVWQHVDADPAVVDWHVDRGVRGLVLAATGAGTMPTPVRAALARAVRRDCLVLRATRVPTGPVIRDNEVEVDDRDSALGFIAAGRLGPLKARILLQCCLAAGLGTDDAARIQAMVDAFA